MLLSTLRLSRLRVFTRRRLVSVAPRNPSPPGWSFPWRTPSASPSRRLSAVLCIALIGVSSDAIGQPTSTMLPTEGQVGPNAEQFGGLAQSASANLFSGDANLSIPIQVPPGRGQATPALALSYSSSGGDGPFGVGWSMPTGSIVRSTKRGTPSCPEDHRFTLILPGATVELVNEPGTSTYYAEVDEGYIEAHADVEANSWVVHDRAGRTYRFGTVPEAKSFVQFDVFMRKRLANGVLA